MNRTNIVNSEKTSLDKIIGLPFHEVQNSYPDCVFAETEASRYDLCGDGTGYEVSRNDSIPFFFWEHWNYATVEGFILLSSEFELNNKLRVGMKLSELLNEFPTAKSFIHVLGENKECIYFSEQNCWVQFDTDEDNRMAEYTFMENGESDFVRYIDTEAKITSIMIKAKD